MADPFSVNEKRKYGVRAARVCRLDLNCRSTAFEQGIKYVARRTAITAVICVKVCRFKRLSVTYVSFFPLHINFVVATN